MKNIDKFSYVCRTNRVTTTVVIDPYSKVGC